MTVDPVTGAGARVLVVNAGSSSVKLRVIGPGDHLEAAHDVHGPPGGAIDEVAAFVAEAGGVDVAGHRVVHGGERFTAATVVDDEVRAALDGLNALAPLHNPPALAGIDVARKLLPGVPSVACFDTTFHAGLRPEATAYALPREWVAPFRIRRYGFHGLSCAWSLRQAAAWLDRPAHDLRVVVCHLGAGASVTAVASGVSVDTTMGFTPLEGLVMATRSGDVDPGALTWLLQQGVTADELDHGLEHRSGLLGLSGRTGDLRQLLADRTAGDGAATRALDVYLHRLRAKIAGMAAASHGVDVLVFTGGVGEHAPSVRAEACGPLAWMGIALDPDANARVGEADADISAPGAAVRTLVVHTREDLTIADDCRRLLAGGARP